MNNKLELATLLATALKKSILIGENEIRVYIMTAEEAPAMAVQITKEINKALKAGKSVTVDGVRTFHTSTPVIDTTKQGSEMYTWNKPGTKVRHDVIEHSLTVETGAKTTKVIGQAFKVW